MTQIKETIYAMATPPGRSAIAVIRISGAFALQVPGLFGQPPLAGRGMRYARLQDRQGAPLDEVLLLSFAGPHSATGEDVLEIHCHGSPAVLAGIIAILAGCDQLRAAEAGEFSRRTLLNGKKDITEIEGLADLIEAETDLQRVQALRQMQGALSLPAADWRGRILKLLSQLEALIDFADEELPPDLAEHLDQQADQLIGELTGALAGAGSGELVRQGVRLVLIGPANAGKSTTLNQLAGRAAAIVSDEAGTTRDIVELRLDVRGVPVWIADTAGWRQAGGKVEAEGIRRAQNAAADADFLVIVLDASAANWPEQLAELQGWGSAGKLVLLNKADQATAAEKARITAHFEGGELDWLMLSMQQDGAAAQLEKRLADRLIPQNISAADTLITRRRHATALSEACAALQAGQTHALASAPELRAEQYRRAADALGRLAGKLDVEELLDQIFSRFCIGK
ncbi:MAG: tRNA uridine-5-carboxymethylaminomethyl(34) synthesis GTPase MnmE [Alphaproteobacteria bacterium]|nr:tRNA uridine-5-carboxymethylaminomethyl(34) synthesis GTPase MnmE [Alphaproteobacteria bacterium]